MKAGSVFRESIPGWLIKAGLVFCTLPSTVLLGLYNSNATYTSGYLGVEPEDMQFIMSITYGALIATMLIENRFYRFFATRNYLLGISVLSVLALMLSAYVKNFTLFIFLRVFDGIVMALPGGVMIQLLLTRFKSKSARIIVFSFFYSTLLCSPAIIANMVAFTLDRWDWRYMIYGAVGVQLFGMLIILLIFNNNRLHRSLPLYQIDYAGYILLLAVLLCGTYVLVYGEKRYWLHAWDIRLSLTVTIIFSGLFILRQRYAKRPLFNFDVLKDPNIRSGLLIFIVLYTCRATLNMVHATMVQVWHWEQLYIARVQWINAGGVVIGIVLAGWLLARQFPVRYIFSIAFAAMAVYLFWFRWLYKLDVGIEDIALPYMLQGFSVGFIFTPLVLFIVSQAPAHLSQYATRAGAATRFWGTSLGFCITHNLQVFLQRKHYISLSQYVTGTNPIAEGRIAAATQSFIAKGYPADQAANLAFRQIDGSVRAQSILLGNMEIFTYLGIFVVCFIVLILFNNHLRHTYNLFRNKIFGY
ncbi:MFS transporter [Chitinophaga skermanii]|uniref:MFS transporter n=1 Tax=Chitinophaga skermanii TaxID=331697 RepID=A0A327QEL9_9BACT|nr:MFS transporter [Chitinophaga skermanii]RAJ02318.1 MFS transporter [Chitinophaga skermanii]